MAKAAYGRGSYPTCCDLLEKAALKHNENSILGGEIRLWLALTYQVIFCRLGNAHFYPSLFQALGKTKECVELFRRLEDHPNKKTRRQAKDLLYIIEAPKLRIGEDERVELPVLKDLERAPSFQPSCCSCRSIFCAAAGHGCLSPERVRDKRHVALPSERRHSKRVSGRISSHPLSYVIAMSRRPLWRLRCALLSIRVSTDHDDVTVLVRRFFVTSWVLQAALPFSKSPAFV